MEILKLVPLLGLLLFCSRIFYSYRKYSKTSTFISAKKPILKTILTLIFLTLFFIVFLTELVFQSSFISFSFLPIFFRQQIIYSQILNSIGVGSIILSVLSIHFTLISFRSSLRFGLNPLHLGKLITTGIFSRSRNPFFASIILLFTGITFVFPTAFFIGITVLTVISIHLFILKEEKFMCKNYSEEYRKYRMKVRRYF